jgi:hypothetical protein
VETAASGHPSSRGESRKRPDLKKQESKPGGTLKEQVTPNLPGLDSSLCAHLFYVGTQAELTDSEELIAASPYRIEARTNRKLRTRPPVIFIPTTADEGSRVNSTAGATGKLELDSV